jgi:hypothetical protein
MEETVRDLRFLLLQAPGVGGGPGEVATQCGAGRGGVGRDPRGHGGPDRRAPSAGGRANCRGGGLQAWAAGEGLVPGKSPTRPRPASSYRVLARPGPRSRGEGESLELVPAADPLPPVPRHRAPTSANCAPAPPGHRFLPNPPNPALGPRASTGLIPCTMGPRRDLGSPFPAWVPPAGCKRYGTLTLVFSQPKSVKKGTPTPRSRHPALPASTQAGPALGHVYFGSLFFLLPSRLISPPLKIY